MNLFLIERYQAVSGWTWWLQLFESKSILIRGDLWWSHAKTWIFMMTYDTMHDKMRTTKFSYVYKSVLSSYLVNFVFAFWWWNVMFIPSIMLFGLNKSPSLIPHGKVQAYIKKHSVSTWNCLITITAVRRFLQTFSN